MNGKSRIALLRQHQGEQNQDLVGELAPLVAQLRRRYPEHQGIARALGVHRSTLTLALKGQCGRETLQALVATAHTLLAAPAASAAAPAAAAAGVATLQELLSRFAGEESPLGVRFVLGPGSFRELEADPSEAAIERVCTLVETVRGLLNVLAQLKDDSVRARVQKRLAREVEELELAIRAFSLVYPNQLTALHAAQRRAWGRSVPSSGRRR